MEDNKYPTEQNITDSSPLPIPQITLESLGFLNTTAKWTKFLAIMGFIGIGIMLIAGLFMGVVFSVFNYIPTNTPMPFPMRWFGLIYIILAVVYIFPVIYLNNFSNYISKAVTLRETVFLTIALNNIKRHFKYMGISTIVLIASYFIAMVVFVIFMAHTISRSM